MAAKLIDERPEEDNVDTAELDTREEQFESPQEQTQQASTRRPYLRSTEVSLLQNLHVCTKKLRSY
jgi:hypothetical protein